MFYSEICRARNWTLVQLDYGPMHDTGREHCARRWNWYSMIFEPGADVL